MKLVETIAKEFEQKFAAALLVLAGITGIYGALTVPNVLVNKYDSIALMLLGVGLTLMAVNRKKKDAAIDTVETKSNKETSENEIIAKKEKDEALRVDLLLAGALFLIIPMIVVNIAIMDKLDLFAGMGFPVILKLGASLIAVYIEAVMCRLLFRKIQIIFE